MSIFKESFMFQMPKAPKDEADNYIIFYMYEWMQNES